MIVIEHNLDVIKTADYIIAGPEGGDGGEPLVRLIAQVPESPTDRFLQKVLADRGLEQRH